MATTRHGAAKRQAMICPACGVAMIHHANKLIDPRSDDEARLADPDLGGIVEESHSCPGCGQSAARRAG